MSRLLLVAFLAFTGVIHASITAAWKVPIEHFAPDHANNAKVRKVEKPPGESGFFKTGDELWDVSKALSVLPPSEDPFSDSPADAESQPWSGDWAVWNGRTGLLVARGSFAEILQAQEICGFNRRESLARIRFEVMTGTEAKPKHAISLVSKNGERTSAEADGMNVEVESTFGGENFHDLRLSVGWPSANAGRKWQVNTSSSGENDRRVRVARQGSGDSGWELFASISKEAVDGAPAKDARWIEMKAGVIRVWPEAGPMLEIIRQPIDERLILAWYDVPPFETLPQPVDLEAPVSLRDWIEGQFVNCNELLKKARVKVDTPGFFAGYDSSGGMLVVAADAATHAHIARLFSGLHPDPPAMIWVESSQSAGSWGLLARSGEKALVTLGAGKDLAEFQIEPTSADSQTKIDLKCRLDVIANGRRGSHFEFETVLPTGQAADFGIISSPGREDTKLTITASLLSR